MAIDFFEKRRAGVLLHLTSLPSTLGNGTMGKQAYRFVDFLRECGLSVWQVLPIHPPQNVPVGTPHRDFLSPYQPQSVHAGNPMLIDLEKLINKGWLPRKSLSSFNIQDDKQLEQSFEYRRACLKEAYPYFSEHAPKTDHDNYQQFIKENSEWLDDYALFCALKDFNKGTCWWDWQDKGYRNYEPTALNEARKSLADSIEQYRFIQFAFFNQWHELRKYADENGVYLFGDMPFFVARDSVDVWSKRDHFLLDEEGKPTVVAGVPHPDHYSTTGQCWGNPLYKWDTMMQNGDQFQWWIERFKTLSQFFDLIRLSHFRGFKACWAIPEACDPDASQGKWIEVPGKALFETLFKTPQPALVLVVDDVEDLSNEEVIALRNQFNLPSIKILQLAFSDKDTSDYYLPHYHARQGVVYTGTHDNNSTLGWFEELSEKVRQYVCKYLDNANPDMPWVLINTALASPTRLAIIPMQDILGLGAEHRMNTPGTSNSRNWRWQFKWLQITSDIEKKLKELVERYERN